MYLTHIPAKAHHLSWGKWHRLLRILCIVDIAISGADIVFTCLRHLMKISKGQNMNLTTPVHDKLNIWWYLVASLATQTTHLRDILSHPQNFIGTTYDSLEGMRGICRILTVKWHVWCLPISTATCQYFLKDDNPKGGLTINNLDLAGYVAPIHIFFPHIAPIKYNSTQVDNNTARVSVKRVRMRSSK